MRESSNSCGRGGFCRISEMLVQNLVVRDDLEASFERKDTFGATDVGWHLGEGRVSQRFAGIQKELGGS